VNGWLAAGEVEQVSSEEVEQTGSEVVELIFNGVVPESVRFQDALEMHRNSIAPRKCGAAVVAEMRVDYCPPDIGTACS